MHESMKHADERDYLTDERSARRRSRRTSPRYPTQAGGDAAGAARGQRAAGLRAAGGGGGDRRTAGTGAGPGAGYAVVSTASSSRTSRRASTRVWVCRSISLRGLRRRGIARAICARSWASSPAKPRADGRVTLEFAECLGACDVAPAMLVNDTLHGEHDEGEDRRVGEEL